MFKVDAMIVIAILTVSIKCDLSSLAINCSGGRSTQEARSGAYQYFGINQSSEFYMENDKQVFRGTSLGVPYDVKYFTKEQVDQSDEAYQQVATEMYVGKNIMVTHPQVVGFGTCFGNKDFIYYGRYNHGNTLRQNISDNNYNQLVEQHPLLPLYLASQAVELIEEFHVNGIALNNFGADNLYHKNIFDIFVFNFSEAYFDLNLSDRKLDYIEETLVGRENIRLENQQFLNDYVSLKLLIGELFAPFEGKPIQTILLASFERFFNKLASPLYHDSDKKMVIVFTECVEDAYIQLNDYGKQNAEKTDQIQAFQRDFNSKGFEFLDLSDIDGLAERYGNKEFHENPELKAFLKSFFKAMMYFESFKPGVFEAAIYKVHKKLSNSSQTYNIHNAIRSLNGNAATILNVYVNESNSFKEFTWKSTQRYGRLII